MSDVTLLLARVSEGDTKALHGVFETLYPELKRIARARGANAPHTLTPTTLVHEAFVRLIGNKSLSLSNRRHFLACAARAMRAIVVDHVRRATAAKRGGAQADLSLDTGIEISQAFPEDMLALDAALEQLEIVNPRQREVVELHFFAGLSFEEIGALLDCHERTAKREWARGRAFLYAVMDGSEDADA